MESDVGQGGELNAALIPGPNHPKKIGTEAVSDTFIGSLIAWLVFVGIFGVYTLTVMAFHGVWWPFTIAFALLVILALLNHFNPRKSP